MEYFLLNRLKFSLSRLILNDLPVSSGYFWWIIGHYDLLDFWFINDWIDLSPFKKWYFRSGNASKKFLNLKIHLKLCLVRACRRWERCKLTNASLPAVNIPCLWQSITSPFILHLILKSISEKKDMRNNLLALVPSCSWSSCKTVEPNIIWYWFW